MKDEVSTFLGVSLTKMYVDKIIVAQVSLEAK